MPPKQKIRCKTRDRGETKAMEREKQPYEETVKKLFGFLLDAGFVYEYTYDKGSDSSCVYILRFRKGRDFIDLRTVSGGAERNLVVFSGGQYLFPSLRLRHKKEFRAFRLRHLFSRPDETERLAFEAALLRSEISGGSLFGIPLG